MTTVQRPNWKKAAISALLGGLMGFGAMFAFFEWGGGEELEALGGDRIAVAAVGIVYFLTGLIVAFGLLAPRAGAKILNVEDADELIEMRGQLTRSVATFLLTGALLLVLSGSGEGGTIRDEVVLGATALVLLVCTLLTWLTYRSFDELWRQLSNESSAAALGLLVPALLVWSVLAHLGRVEMSPLGVIALTAALILVGTFIATGRRGMLTPK